MNFDQFDWTSGLDESGWIAAGLFALFFIIAIIVVAMMLKLNADNKKTAHKKSFKDIQESDPPPVNKPRPTSTRNSQGANESTNAIEEAEVFLTYGLNKQAADVLEKHLIKNPADKTAREMLERAQAELQQ